MTLQTWLAFFTASWLISLSPGPGAIASMTTGLNYGWKKGIWNILGLQAGIAILVALIAAGIGTIVASSLLIFNIIKWLGAIYLIWIGIQQWRQTPQARNPLVEDNYSTDSSWILFKRACLINISNPKGIVFLLAVLPQFIDPHKPQLIQYVICGATLIFTDFIVMNGYTYFAAKVLQLLKEPAQIKWSNRFFGGMFILVGGFLAVFKRHA